MGCKGWLLFIGSYMAALFVNLWPAMFYPDSTFTPWMIGFSAMLLIVLALLLNRMPLFSKGNFVIIVLFFVGSFGGAFIYIANTLSWTWSESFVLNVLSNGQFLFYLPFVVPLFGLNYFFALPFQQFSLLVGVFYFIVVSCLLFYKKRMLQKGASIQ